MIETVLLAISSFVGTNIDDILINTLCFSLAKTKRERYKVVIGKYVGIGILILISVLGALGLQWLPKSYLDYLGVVPILLGLKEILSTFYKRNVDAEAPTEQTESNLIVHTALLTIANGADNVGVYLPLFAGFTIWQILLTAGIFFLMTAPWCVLGYLLANLPMLKTALTKYRPILVPIVYIALGIYIFLR